MFLQSNINAQSLLYKIPIEEQIEKSSLIVEGRVVERKSYLSNTNNHIYTVNKIEVFRVFKGEQQDFVNVVTKGGSINFKKEDVKPSLQLRENNIGVFILAPESNKFENFNTTYNIYHAYSDIQGFYFYDEYENTAGNPYYTFSGIKESFYTKLTSITDTNIELINYEIPSISERAGKGLATATINSFEPTEVRSGIGETVTITGDDFGDNNGIIQFRDADNGGATFEAVFDSSIVSWSNESITVRVPSFAGTGNIQIITNSGDFITSTDELVVLSSELNAEFVDLPEESFRSKLFNSDGQGGYTWVFNEDFYENTDAVEAFGRAVDSWVCATGISWLISDSQSSIVNATDDGVNLVTFKGGNESRTDDIEPGILAVTSTYYLGCINGDTVTSYVAEVDMTFNSDFSWNFDEGEPDQFENDFQGTATHELGHAHNLGHVIAPTNLMHFETSSGPDSATRIIDIDSEIGAAINFEFSKTPGLCDEDNESVTDRECNDRTVSFFSEDLVAVNNPVNNNIELAVSRADILNFSFFLYDMNGRLVDFSLSGLSVDVSSLANGVYIAKIIVGSEIRVQKILKI